MQTHMSFTDAEDAVYIDKGPEFWAGWALAFYQWHSGYSFMEILKAVPLEEIIDMFPIFHEMDIMHFVDRMQDAMKEAYPDTRLKMYREICGLSQSQLSLESGVFLHWIQQFEQRQRNINKTSAETLLRLSKALFCSMEDLMER